MLTWRVVVEGHSNTLPGVSSTVLPPHCQPEIHWHAVSSGFNGGKAVANTVGGTRLLVRGTNFGPLEQYIQVAVTLPVGPCGCHQLLPAAGTPLRGYPGTA